MKKNTIKRKNDNEFALSPGRKNRKNEGKSYISLVRDAIKIVIIDLLFLSALHWDEIDIWFNI